MRYLAFLFILVVLPNFNAQLLAQEYPFFTVTSEPYEPLQGGTNLVNSTWDDPEFVVPFGFSFDFFNRSISGAAISTDFTNVLFADNLLSNVTSLFILYGADLIDRGYLDNQHLSPIRYRTTGSAGERVLTLEYVNAGFLGDLFSNGTSSDFVNFQMKLYEASGDIVFHFGPSSVSFPELDYGVYPGPIVGIAEDYDIETDQVLGEIVLLSGSPSSPEIHLDYGNYALDGSIPENTVYRFSRELMSSVAPNQVVERQLYYPNPATDVLYLKDIDLVDSPERVCIYHSTGQKVLETKEIQSIPVNKLTPGIYTLKMERQTSAQIQRVVILPE